MTMTVTDSLTEFEQEFKPTRFRRRGRLNLPELRRQVAWARADVEEIRELQDGISWSQVVWIDVPDPGYRYSCRTTACIAGHTVLTAGATPIGNNSDYVMWHDEEWSIPYLAQSLLGLTNRQAEELFNSENDIQDLEAIIARWGH